jgi:hypothetical protein
MKDSAAMSGLKDSGHPGDELRHWLAITGEEVCNQKGREMLSVSNNRVGESRSQDWKTHMF